MSPAGVSSHSSAPTASRPVAPNVGSAVSERVPAARLIELDEPVGPAPRAHVRPQRSARPRDPVDAQAEPPLPADAAVAAQARERGAARRDDAERSASSRGGAAGPGRRHAAGGSGRRVELVQVAVRGQEPQRRPREPGPARLGLRPVSARRRPATVAGSTRSGSARAHRPHVLALRGDVVGQEARAGGVRSACRVTAFVRGSIRSSAAPSRSGSHSAPPPAPTPNGWRARSAPAIAARACGDRCGARRR